MNVVIAMTVFVLSHVMISRTRVKPALIARFGERTYFAAYSALSLVLLGWVIWSVLEADPLLIWTTPPWAYGFAAVLTLAGFLLLGIGALTANPLSISFHTSGFNPDRPGVIGWVRHPLIWGFTLWGLGHVPANGSWPSLVLFAGSAVFGVVGIYAVERRLKRRLGDEEWRRLSAGRGHFDRKSLIGVSLGLGLWLILLALHPILFGTDPLVILLGQR